MLVLPVYQINDNIVIYTEVIYEEVYKHLLNFFHDKMTVGTSMSYTFLLKTIKN